jgi:hypothetical protein
MEKNRNIKSLGKSLFPYLATPIMAFSSSIYADSNNGSLEIKEIRPYVESKISLPEISPPRDISDYTLKNSKAHQIPNYNFEKKESLQEEVPTDQSLEERPRKYDGELRKTGEAINNVVPRDFESSREKAKEGIFSIGRGMGKAIDGIVYPILGIRPVQATTKYADLDSEDFELYTKSDFLKSLPVRPVKMLFGLTGGVYESLGGIWEVGRQGVNSGLAIPLNKISPTKPIAEALRIPLYITPHSIMPPTGKRAIDSFEEWGGVIQNKNAKDLEGILSTPSKKALGIIPENIGNGIVYGTQEILDDRSLTIRVLDATGGFIGLINPFGNGTSSSFSPIQSPIPDSIGGGVTGSAPGGN